MTRDIITRDDPISVCEIGLAQVFFLFLLKKENSVIWGRIQDFSARASRHGPPAPVAGFGAFLFRKILKIEVLGNEIFGILRPSQCVTMPYFFNFFTQWILVVLLLFKTDSNLFSVKISCTK